MPQATLPAYARRAINRCNLPAIILGGLTFQQFPSPLFIDGVRELHGAFFRSLAQVQDAAVRADCFRDYMRASFLLDDPGQAGFDPRRRQRRRDKADYLRLLRGWMFNADSVEGAVLKYWVESRFGLMPRRHQGLLGGYASASYDAYRMAYTRGLYNTNALEAQLDLLYAYCQYELQRTAPDQTHWHLYRGVNQFHHHDILARNDDGSLVLLLNNLNSFSRDQAHAESFGDCIFATDIPFSKVLYFPGLLPGVLQGEWEYLVIGGAYRVTLAPALLAPPVSSLFPRQ